MLYALDCNMVLPAAEAATLLRLLNEAWSPVRSDVGEQAPALSVMGPDSVMVSASLKFADQEARDALAEQLIDLKSAVTQGSRGFIASHNCSHDEGGACGEVRADAWGGPDG